MAPQVKFIHCCRNFVCYILLSFLLSFCNGHLTMTRSSWSSIPDHGSKPLTVGKSETARL
ncbi:unknown protein [Microcystis aeruginosa NIES-843]|uniref:Uncharacterized protein n=1 Tax=Microcystis aeruginosa (strain NIES-843 / IAM M-2473) TaxID=449447 RepID=B0JHB3_MICAN|nr:unknown protein [Microcystis aeruginosa NIES-843]